MLLLIESPACAPSRKVRENGGVGQGRGDAHVLQRGEQRGKQEGDDSSLFGDGTSSPEDDSTLSRRRSVIGALTLEMATLQGVH